MKTNSFTNPTIAAAPCRRAAPSKRTSPAGMPALPGSEARGARRPSLSLLIALLAAAALITHIAFAGKPPPPPATPPPSSGTLVLDYLYPGGTHAVNYGLAVAPSGTIYASGIAGFDYVASTDRGLVLGSSDSGTSWSLLDDFAPPGRFIDAWDVG